MTFPVLPVIGKARRGSSPTTVQMPQTPIRMASVKPLPVKGKTLYVVTVGINEYSQAEMNLEFAAPDAVAIGRLLKSKSKTVFENVSVTTLLNDQATRKGILAAIEKVADVARPDDTLAVFLAGHGVMSGQRYYFVPANFSQRTGTSQDAIRSQGLPADALGDAIAKVAARQRLLIFDTCASGGAIHLSKQGADPFAFRGAIEQLGKEGGTFTLAAVGATDEAQEVKELGHGVLTYCLLSGAQAIDLGPLRNRSLKPAAAGGVADVLEWFSYAAGNVPRVTKQYFGKEQQVQLGGQGKAFSILGL